MKKEMKKMINKKKKRIQDINSNMRNIIDNIHIYNDNDIGVLFKMFLEFYEIKHVFEEEIINFTFSYNRYSTRDIIIYIEDKYSIRKIDDLGKFFSDDELLILYLFSNYYSEILSLIRIKKLTCKKQKKLIEQIWLKTEFLQKTDDDVKDILKYLDYKILDIFKNKLNDNDFITKSLLDMFYAVHKIYK